MSLTPRKGSVDGLETEPGVLLKRALVHLSKLSDWWLA